jgi:hypothetical protein
VYWDTLGIIISTVTPLRGSPPPLQKKKKKVKKNDRKNKDRKENLKEGTTYHNTILESLRAPPCPQTSRISDSTQMRRSGGIILLGDDTSGGAVMLRPIKFQCV